MLAITPPPGVVRLEALSEPSARPGVLPA